MTARTDVRDALRRLARGEVASSEERDRLLEEVAGAAELRPKDVVWMLFRPDRAVRDAGVSLLARSRSPEVAELVLGACRGQPEAAVRAAMTALLAMNIPGLPAHLGELLGSDDARMRDLVRRLVLQAPASTALEPLLWGLVDDADGPDRLTPLRRLAGFQLSDRGRDRWRGLARDEDRDVREIALPVLAEHDPEGSLERLVEALPRAGYATQQKIVAALTSVAAGRGVEIADRILPLIASGDTAARSAVVSVLLGTDPRPEIVRKLLAFCTGLAGWARERALDSLSAFGADVVEPVVELLDDPGEGIRMAALAVAGHFDDPRIVPTLIGLLDDPDWWIRITAAENLGRIGDRRAVDDLTAALDDAETRWAAVEALGRIGDPRALPALARLLKNPAAEIRIEVVMALEHFRHPKILEALRSVAATDPDRVVRGRALEIAERVAERDRTVIPDVEKMRAAALRAEPVGDGPRLHRLLVETRNRGASDLHLAVCEPPTVRVAADLARTDAEPLAAGDVEGLLHEALSDEQWRAAEESGQLDLCLYVPRAGRYRGNVFRDRGGWNAVFRVIPEHPPTLAEIGLPASVGEIADHHQGLVLVCGASGSGKSTTLASLVNLFNETRHAHVITLEDPVEFVHPFKQSLINQREVGSHTRSFARALRAALREDPDVIVIGDLRDAESISLALTAAETGHIVLATLNATGAVKAIERLISTFPADAQPRVRTSLGESLRFVLAQRLLPGLEPGRRVACFEVLKGTFGVAALIRDQKTFQIPSLMQIGRAHGMQTFDDALKDLVHRQRITPETAYMAADARHEFEAMVDPEFLRSELLV